MNNLDGEYCPCVYFRTKNREFTRAITKAAIDEKLSSHAMSVGGPEGFTQHFLVFIPEEEDKIALKEICGKYEIDIDIN